MKSNFQLSTISRILVAFASGALIAVYFLPAWRIDLFAPQYPEGLSMYIWINKLSGDVDIINGLNHYIGMKHISEAMFPEFGYLPYVVAAFMALGMLAAITGNGRLLFLYVVLTIIGGLLVPYDLYRWGYVYGHDLDPKAPIQVPGLSYQPPVFGHKRLLNFDAYSFPDVAGWIVVGAGALAVMVFVMEWYRHRKLIRSIALSRVSVASGLILMFLLMVSCSTKPQPFVAGRDACSHCKMIIADLSFGGELITSKGKIFKFDDMGCMLDFLKSEENKDLKYKQILAIDHDHPGQFLAVEKAWFLQSNEMKSPMGSHLTSYANKEEAEKSSNNQAGVIYSWDQLFNNWK